jgi:cobalt-zinc-cadmium resistance protein CzcA
MASIFLIPIIGLLSLNSQQTKAQELTHYLSLDSAMAYGLANNGSIKSADIEVKRLMELEKTTFNLGKTDFGIMYGQYNSFERDFGFTIDQKFLFPNVYINQRQLAKSNLEMGELQKKQTENELRTEIKRTWYKLAYLKEVSLLLSYQSGVYTKFLRAAELRYETEAGTLLEKVNAESKVTSVEVSISQNEANIKIFKKRLQILLNSPNFIDLPEDFLIKKELSLFLDTSIIESNTRLGLLMNMIQIREKESSIEKSKIIPEFSFGYFNQSLIGSHLVDGVEQSFGANQRFSGIQATISIPIWAKPDVARVKAANLEKQKAINDAAYYHSLLLSEYERVVQDYYKFKVSLEYFENNALPQAELILSNSTKSFDNGAISYVEYIQSLNTGIDIKSNYLTLLMQYNESIIAIEFLAGKK